MPLVAPAGEGCQETAAWWLQPVQEGQDRGKKTAVQGLQGAQESLLQPQNATTSLCTALGQPLARNRSCSGNREGCHEG